jgi:hypothetical protein
MALVPRPDLPATVRPARLAVSAPAVAGLAGGGALAAVAGLPLLAVGAVAVVGWLAGGVLAGVVRVLRRLPAPGPEPRNPYSIPPPWRELVTEALGAQAKFAVAAAGAPDGPFRIRLDDLNERVAAAVDECWSIAEHGASVDQAVARLDPQEIRRRLALARAHGEGEVGSETVGAIQAQLDAVARLQQLSSETRQHLQLLVARLGESVADAVELTIGAPPAALSGLEPVTGSVRGIVEELHAMRGALAEAGGAEPEAPG